MNPKIFKLSSIAFSLAFLFNILACATLDESECKVANWEIIGLEDGSAGRDTSYIGEHREACAEYRIAPDLDAYLKGHAAGLRRFCTEQNGYQQGLRGRSNNQICPADLSAAFQRGYRKGERIHQVQSEISQLKRALDSHEARLHEIAEIKILKEEELVSNQTRERRRRMLLEEIKDLERETESIHIEIDEINGALFQLENKHQRIRGSGY